MPKHTTTWVCSMSCIGKTYLEHWVNIRNISPSVGATIVSSGLSGRQDGGRARRAGRARLARNVTAGRACRGLSDSSRLPIWPRPPVGPPLGSWPHIIRVGSAGDIFRSCPNLHALDVDDGIGILRLIQW